MAVEPLQQSLKLTVAQHTTAGVKHNNEDCIAIQVPSGSLLARKGAVVAIADGVSTAEAAQEASEIAVTGFLNDYYSTPDSWSVKQSGHKVLVALNRWLFGQGQKYLTAEKGYLTTFSALILKSRSAYLFHVGDTRIYRFRDDQLELLTRDHVAKLSVNESYLARALGIDLNLDVDFRVVDLQPGDLFFLSTDGVHDFISHRELESALRSASNLEQTTEALVQTALTNQSRDNLSCQLVRVDAIGQETGEDVFQVLNRLPFPPELSIGFKLDGWRVVDQVHASQRSQLYRVVNEGSSQKAIMKTPSVNYEDDAAYIERFIMEEWVARRIDSDYVVKVIPAADRRFLYYLTEPVEGPTLGQALADNQAFEISDVVGLVGKLVKGLRAFHRRETLHQDIKPDNIVLRENGDPVIIDFGSVYVAGVDEIATTFNRERALGTLDYSAPEYRLQRPRSEKSDQFSLAVVAYELLTGHHPFGDKFQKAQSVADFLSLKYTPAYRHNPLVPVWMDGALKRALQINADLRYEALSEFVGDLESPNPNYLSVEQRPLLERDPLRFWQWACGLLLLGHLVWLVLWLR